MQTKYDDLARLAEAALRKSAEWYTADSIHMGVYQQVDADFVAACTPATIKALLADCGALVEALTEVTATLAWNAHGECRAIHDGPIMPSAQAVETARAALARVKEGA